MIKILEERKTVTAVWYEHSFQFGAVDGWRGYAFTVDENGEYTGGNEAASENFRKCKSGEMTDSAGTPITDLGVRKVEEKYKVGAIGLCACGEHVELADEYMGACQCHGCGQWYNMAGQELIPPEYWDMEG